MERLERIETQVSSQEDSLASVSRLRRLAHVDVGSGRHTCTSFGQRRPCSIDGIEGDAAALPRSLGDGRKPDQGRMKNCMWMAKVGPYSLCYCESLNNKSTSGLLKRALDLFDFS